MPTSETELHERMLRLEAIVASLVTSESGRTKGRRPALSERERLYLAHVRANLLSEGRDPSRSVRELELYVEVLAMQLAGRIDLARETHNRLQVDVHTVFALLSIDADVRTAKLPRFLPVRVYLGSENARNTETVVRGVEETLTQFGFSVVDDFPPEKGSFFKRWFMRSKELMTGEEVQERVRLISQELKRGLENETLERRQSEINKNNAEGIAAILQSIANEDNAAVQFGTTLLVKTTDELGKTNIGVVTITAIEAVTLENNRDLIKSPRTLMDHLDRVRQDKCIGGTRSDGLPTVSGPAAPYIDPAPTPCPALP